MFSEVDGIGSNTPEGFEYVAGVEAVNAATWRMLRALVTCNTCARVGANTNPPVISIAAATVIARIGLLIINHSYFASIYA
jgi:hypothetical protein